MKEVKKKYNRLDNLLQAISGNNYNWCTVAKGKSWKINNIDMGLRQADPV